MPDISMCYGNECPLKEECYRYKAKPSFQQSYFVEPPYGKENDKEKECEYFWHLPIQIGKKRDK